MLTRVALYTCTGRPLTCPCRYEPVNVHRLLLPQPVRPILGLAIDLGVEVYVVEDDRVCPRQVEPHATSPRGEEESENRGPGCVEAVAQALPLLPGCGPV